MRKLLIALGLLLLAGIGYHHVNTPERQARQLIEDTTASVVRLPLFEYPDFAGSGFVVDMKDTKEGCFMTVGTARHVVWDDYETTSVYLEDTSGPVSAYVRYSAGADAAIAVFILEGECAIQPYKPVELRPDYVALRGDRLFGMGYPMGEFYFGEGRVLSSVRWLEDLNTWVFATNYATTGGNSGGPIFDMQGRVIGILIGGFRDFPNATFVTPINYLAELLP